MLLMRHCEKGSSIFGWRRYRTCNLFNINLTLWYPLNGLLRIPSNIQLRLQVYQLWHYLMRQIEYKVELRHLKEIIKRRSAFVKTLPYPLGAGLIRLRMELCSGLARGAHSVAPLMGVLHSLGNVVRVLPHSVAAEKSC